MSDSGSSKHETRERQKMQRRRQKLEKQLSKMESHRFEELSEGEGKHKSKMEALKDIMGPKRIRSRLKKKKHQKLLHKILAIEDDRTAENLQEVENFKEILIKENLLPEHHNDYHTILR